MRQFLLLVFLLNVCALPAQDSLYTRAILKELTSEKYNGRGYVKNGDCKAARYIAKEMKSAGLQPAMYGKWFQQFSFPVNTFPSAVKCRLGNRELIPGVDFIVDPGMSTLIGDFQVVTINRSLAAYSAAELKGKFILLDTVGTGFHLDKEDLQAWKKNPFGAAGMIFVQAKKLTWSVSTTDKKFPIVEVLKDVIEGEITTINVEVKAKFIPDYKTANVAGYIPGSTQPDSFVFITAHYDHLGRMGTEAYFPGANDNASGVSMLLNLGRYFTKPENRPSYSLVFVAFAGEEAGLRGSAYYTQQPVVPLNKIRFLLNLDLLGTGDDGMMVVNATEFPAEFSIFDSLNTAGGYMPKLGKRGKAANSDHYYFSEKGVPSFFCYTLGGISAYHDVLDVEKTLPLTRYKEAFGLLSRFIAAMASQH